VTLQKLGDLGSDIGDISLEVNNLNTQLGQTSKWVGELHSTQKGKSTLIFGSYLSFYDLDNSTHLKLEQHLLEVYEWLSPLSKDFASKQFDTFNTAARQDRLGRWLLGTTEYGKWQLTPGSTLWCLGISTCVATSLDLMIEPLCTTMLTHLRRGRRKDCIGVCISRAANRIGIDN